MRRTSNRKSQVTERVNRWRHIQAQLSQRSRCQRHLLPTIAFYIFRKNRIVCSEFDFQAIFTVGAFQQDSEGEWRYIEGENLKDEVGFGTAPEVQYNSLEDLLNKVNEL